MQSTPHVKVVVTGAAGQIGYALLFRIASGQMFGPTTRIDLHLLDLPQALPSLEGVVMELQDCAFPLLERIVYTSDLNEAFNGVNFAVLVGSAPRKQGMERSDLLKINGGIFSMQGSVLNKHAADNVRVFVVGNPCNTNALIAMAHAPDIPRDRFFAMTKLDENRARYQLAAKAGVAIAQVKKMIIWGNHSSTQYPDFHHAMIGTTPATDVIDDVAWLQHDFIQTVQNRGAAIIKARGASSAASAANAALQTIYQLQMDTSPDDYFSVAQCSQGEYGIPDGLIFSFPCQTRNGQLHVIEGLALNDFSKEKIAITTAELQEELEAVKQLGLIPA